MVAKLSRAAVIINPVSGRRRPDGARRARAEQAAELLSRRGIEPEVFLTEYPGHAHELAAAAVKRAVKLVIAWGGDGTVNEVGSALAFTDATLAIVPSGSGNGLARELAIPAEPGRALEIAVAGRDRVMDAGEIDGRLFFNVAGIGFDARVAHVFAAEGQRRGFLRYLRITARELFAYQPAEYTIVFDGQTVRARVLLAAIANARQYGNGAIIAPGARIDDGQLDLVVIEDRSPMRALVQVPRMFMGQVARLPGVTVRRATAVQIAAESNLAYHVDGEPCWGGRSVSAAVRPRALRVKVAESPRIPAR